MPLRAPRAEILEWRGRAGPARKTAHGSVEGLVEYKTEGRRGVVERPAGSSLCLANSDPPCPGVGGGRARVPGSDAEPPCHGPRLRHLAVPRATSRRDGLG